MLYWLTLLSDGGDFFNLFRYITFRAGGAFLTALVFGFLFGKPLIAVLRKRQGKGQPIRDDGPEGHFVKAGTPTMGGLLIVGALLTSTLLWARLDNPFVWMVLLVTMAFAAIGFADDYAKVSKQTTAGVSSRMRLLLGFIIAGSAAYWAAQFHPAELQNQLALPVFKNTLINLGYLFVPFSIIVIVGAANAVNLTDGLDGLAIMPVMIAAGALGVIAYAVGRVDFTEYLDVHYVPGRARFWSLPPVSLAVVWAFCGITRPPPRSLWATPDRWRLAARWGQCPLRPATRWCWPLPAACSFWKPCP